MPLSQVLSMLERFLEIMIIVSQVVLCVIFSFAVICDKIKRILGAIKIRNPVCCWI